MTAAESKSPGSMILPWLRPSRSQPLSRYVGIDIGVDRANIVALGARHCDMRRSSQRTQSMRWLGRHHFSLPVDPLADPPKDWVDRVITSLLDRLPRSVDGDQNIAAVSLPIPWVHYQVVPASEIEVSRQQCHAMFASSLFRSQAHVAYWPLHTEPTRPDEPMVIAAIAESAAYELAEAVSELGYQIETILPHGVTLIDAAESMTGIDPRCCVVLNRSGGLIAMKNQRGCGLCRSLPAIPKQILAEADTLGLTLHAIRPWLTDIAAEITATQRFVLRGQATDANGPLLLCGDIAAVADLDAVLATLTDIPVAPWRYAGKARPSRRQIFDQETSQANRERLFNDSEYAVALSLAYSAVESMSRRNGK